MEKHTGLGVQGVTKVSLPLVTSHVLPAAAKFSIFFRQKTNNKTKQQKKKAANKTQLYTYFI